MFYSARFSELTRVFEAEGWTKRWLTLSLLDVFRLSTFQKATLSIDTFATQRNPISTELYRHDAASSRNRDFSFVAVKNF